VGNCNHRRYVPTLVEVRDGTIDPRRILTEVEPLLSAVDASEYFERREPGWLKVSCCRRRPSRRPPPYIAEIVTGAPARYRWPCPTAAPMRTF
jgi:hypothetical protein